MLNLPSLEAGTPHPRTESVALVVTGALSSIFPEHSPSFLAVHHVPPARARFHVDSRGITCFGLRLFEAGSLGS